MSKIMRMELQAEFKDLIQQAIHHPTKFDPCEVNHDMHESAWSTNGGAIEGDGIEIIGLWNYGDGSQAVKGARIPAVKGARDWLLHLQIPGSDPGIGLGCNMLYIILLSCYISLYAAVIYTLIQACQCSFACTHIMLYYFALAHLTKHPSSYQSQLYNNLRCYITCYVTPLHNRCYMTLAHHDNMLCNIQLYYITQGSCYITSTQGPLVFLELWVRFSSRCGASQGRIMPQADSDLLSQWHLLIMITCYVTSNCIT